MTRCPELSARGFRCVLRAGHFGAHIGHKNGETVRFVVARPLEPDRITQETKGDTEEAGEVTLIRGTHPYQFRSGQWAELLTTAPNPGGSDCYVVRFPDGATDWWVVDDPSETYEFAETSEEAQG